jgi:ferric-dicitrate binding protein FerR (iron transport regulator)
MTSLLCESAQALLSDLLAGTLPADDADRVEAHLADCAFCRAQAEDLAWQDRALSELAAHADLDRLTARIHAALTGAPKEPSKRPSRLVRLVLPLTLAAAVLIAAAWFFWPGPKGPETPAAFARLEQVEGEVYLLGADEKVPVLPGQALFAGQGIEVGEGRVVVAYPDETRLELSGDTVVHWNAVPGAGKTIYLAQGAVVADVAEQPESDPMIVATPHAEVVARGNRFSMVNAAASTHIEVEKGPAEVKRRSDGKSLRVDPGAYLVTSIDEAFAAQPLPPRISQARAVLQGHGDGLWSLSYSLDGATLAVGAADGTVALWDIPSGQVRSRLKGHGKPVRCLAFAPDGQTLATASDDRTVRLWSADGAALGTIKGHPSVAFALQFTPDAQTLNTCSYDRVLRRCEVDSAQVRATVRLQKQPPASEFLACMTFAPDGGLLAWGIKDRTARLWDIPAARERHVLRGHEDAVVATAFTPDGRMLATGSRDRTIRLWDTATGQLQATLRGHRHTVGSLAFAPDGRTLASGSSDTTVKLWDVATLRERATLRGHSKSVTALAFAPDGRTLASGSLDAVVNLWNVPPE